MLVTLALPLNWNLLFRRPKTAHTGGCLDVFPIWKHPSRFSGLDQSSQQKQLRTKSFGVSGDSRKNRGGDTLGLGPPPPGLSSLNKQGNQIEMQSDKHRACEPRNYKTAHRSVHENVQGNAQTQAQSEIPKRSRHKRGRMETHIKQRQRV